MGEGAGDGARGDPQGSGPGALSRLLDELARAPQAGPEAVWGKGLRPGEVLDRFEILRELGRGGFGAVYEALDRDLGRKVALKTLRPGRSRDEWADEQLRREAQAAASLSHPGIVTLHEACTCDRGPYLVMELLRGETLEARLSRGPLPPGEAVEVGLQVARALAHVHGHGLVHRDLKPGNVFLGEDGRVKLLDLGLAHLLGRKSSTGGTPAYVAPEQWRGEEVDGRADVFALGAVLFEMVSGRRAFEVKDERSTALDPGPALALGGKVPRGLARLVARCLSKEPAGRPTAGAAAEALLAIQRGIARPRAARRIGLLVGAGVLAAIAIAAVALRSRVHGPREEDSGNPASTPGPSIAVLPFADLSPGKDQEYFADGLAEEILNALTRVDGLKVIGRTSSFSFKGKKDDLRAIGRKLGASTVLEGSVRRDGARIRVTARLLKAEDGQRVWSEAYERELGGVFAVQDEIAKAVVESLKANLAPASGPALRARRTGSPEAHNQYLLGLHFARQGSRDGFRRAEEAFRKAIALDPGYALAHVGLASALVGRYNAGDSESAAETERMQKQSLAAAERAVQLAPDLAQAYQARGMTRRRFLWDWAAAQQDLDRALALDRNNSEALWNHGFQLAMLGRLPEGIASLERATQVEPLSVEAWRWLGFVSMAAGERARARKALRQALEIAPEHDWALVVSAMGLLAEGRASSALETMERSRTDGWRLWGRALAHHSLGDAAASRRALDALTPIWAHVGTYQIAEIYAWRGERHRAFEWLERCYRERDSGLLLARLDPLLRDLRGDGRYRDLMRKMRLPED